MAEVGEAERKSSAPAGHDAVPTFDVGAARTAPGGVAVTPDDATRRTALGQLAVQAKTEVGAASDPLEHEADRVADQVMGGRAVPAVSSSGPGVRRRVEQQPQPPPAEAPAAPVAEHNPEPASDRVQSLIDASSGRGDPLPAAARSMFESSLGHDLSGVRVHDDEAAHEATATLGALAFTRGNDIYMSAGRFDPVGPEGRRLLAHELAHVVQQDAAPEGSPVRRAADTLRRVPSRPRPAPAPATADGTYTVVQADKSDPAINGRENLRVGSTINLATKTIELRAVPIPTSKASRIPAGQLQVPVKSRRERTGNAYEANWATAVRPRYEGGVTTFLNRLGARAKIGNAYYLLFGPPVAADAAMSGYRPLVGSSDDIMTALWRPFWTRGGDYQRFQIDHIRDVSLGGTDDAGNLRLLDATSNMTLGPLVRNPVKEAVQAMVAFARTRSGARVPTFAQVDAGWDQVWIRTWGSGPDVADQKVWEASQMTARALTAPLHAPNRAQRERLRGSPDRMVLYSSGHGGGAIEIPYHPEATGRVPVAHASRHNRFEIQSIRMTSVEDAVVPNSKVGELSVYARYRKQWIRDKQVKLDILGMTGVPYGGVVTSAAATEKFGQVFEHASPFAFDTLDLDLVQGFVGRATLRPSLEVLRNAELAIVVENGEIFVETTISAAELTVPGPITITSGVLFARIGTSLDHPSVGGQLTFEVRDLARGSVRLGFSDADGFTFAGHLGTLPDKPYDASVDVLYRQGHWSANGHVAVGPGKIAGITSGRADVALAADRLSVEGTFESSFRGLSGGHLSMTQDPVTGTTIAGALTLGRLPGIEGGEVAGRVQQTPAGAWSLSGAVTARPSIPGVTGAITGRYENGAFLAEADLGYHRGLLDGRMHLGITNQHVGPDGRPAGPPVPGHLVVWGGGSLRLQLTPWLIGTAAVEVHPDGTVNVAGGIALPDAFTLFERRQLNRRLFSIGIDVPIVGIAVAGQRVGIFATVSGGLDLVAGIGPGQLLGTGIQVFYNPDREDETRVEGDTRLVVPADAGLRLFIRGGVGAGIPLVSAEAGVELGGQLGLAGQLTANAHLLWTRSQGLVFDAEAGLTVQPKFTFTADVFATVSVGIGWLSKDIYDEHWRLAAFEYGSDLRFGVFLPIHAEAGRFDFSLDRVRFEYPSIDPMEIATGVIRHIVG